MNHFMLALLLVGSGPAGAGIRPQPIVAKLAPTAAAQPAGVRDWVERSYRACVAARGIADQSVDPASRPALRIARIRNFVRLTRAGRVLWNGATVDLPTLRQYLDVTANITPTPFLVVDTEPGAPPALVQRVHEFVVRSNVCPGLPS